jgi:hypothetical protein
MKRSLSSRLSGLIRVRRDRRGAATLIIAAALAGLIGFLGLVVDVGIAYRVQSALQASTDAAALAAGQDINSASAGTAVATAISYSSVAGNKNVIPGITATMSAGYPILKCFTSTGIPCTGTAIAGGANGIVVQQQATVPTFFAGMFGMKSFNIGATADASASGGFGKALDVVVIVDTTDSMNSGDPSCGNLTKIACALKGVRTILSTLTPSADYVGLMVFPGLTNATQAALDYNCSSNTKPTDVAYGSTPAPVYQITPLLNDYRTSNAATTLNAASNIVIASNGGSCGTNRLTIVGGRSTYYADAITAAQAVLAASTHLNTQKVIILLSDGAANATGSDIVASKATNECAAGVAAAATAAKAGTWVYSIAYQASKATTSTCTTDAGKYSGCSAMQAIASDPTKFFTDNQTNCPSTANNSATTGLQAAFSQVAFSLLPPRLLANNTQ